LAAVSRMRVGRMVKEKKIQVTDPEIIRLGQNLLGLRTAIVTLGKELGNAEVMFWKTVHERFPEIPDEITKVKYDHQLNVISYEEAETDGKTKTK